MASLQQTNCFTWNADKECGVVEQQIASSLILWWFGCFTWNTGRGGWVVGDGFWELFSSSSLPRSWRFTWNILLNYRWTSGTYSNLFVGMIEAYSAAGKIYLHQQAENQNLTWSSLHTEVSHVWGCWISFIESWGSLCGWGWSVFHVERGGVVELWGRQFEKYHFSPTCYRGVSVSRGTWVRDVLGLGRCVYGSWVVSFFFVLWWCGGFTWNVVGCWILFSCCVSRGTWVRMYVWHVGIKETYSDVWSLFSIPKHD